VDLSNISIIKLLPPNLARDTNVRVMCEAFDEELRRVIAGIPGIAVIPNLVLKRITDNVLLDLLAWQFHCDFYDMNLPVEKKQEVIYKSLDWHTRKGTPSVVEEIVSTFFSRAEVHEWFDYGGLPYRFRITTEDPMPDIKTFNEFVRAIFSVKNTRSMLDSITSIARAEADVYAGIMPRMNGITNVIAKEYEPYIYFGSIARNHLHTTVLAKEYEPYKYCGIMPIINIRTDILSAEV
jgi:phage tail P2-like protein